MPALISLNRHSPQARGLQAWAPFGGGLTQRPYWGADYAGTALGAARITERGLAYYSDGTASNLISSGSVKNFNPYQGTLVVSIIPRVASGPASRSNFFGVFKTGSTAEYVGFALDPWAWDKIEGIIREDTSYSYAMQLEPTKYTVDEFYLYAYKYKWDGATGYDVELHKFGGPTIYEYDSNNAITNSLMTTGKEMRVFRNSGFELDILDGRYYDYLVPEALLWQMFRPETRNELYAAQRRIWAFPTATSSPVIVNAAVGTLTVAGLVAAITTQIRILAATGTLSVAGLAGQVVETAQNYFTVELQSQAEYAVELDESNIVQVEVGVSDG